MRRPALLFALLLLPTVAVAQPKGPPYYDPNRSLEKQREARKEAVTKARGGKPAEVAPLLNDVSGWVRDDVFEVVRRADDERLLKGLARYLGDRRTPLLTAAIAELYGEAKFEAGRKPLEGVAQKAGFELAQLEAIWALEAIGSESSAKALEKAHKRGKTYRVKGDALIALAVVDKGRARKPIDKALKGKFAPLLIAAIEASARISMPDGVEAANTVLNGKALGKLGKAKGWQSRVLFCACDLLERWYERSAKPELLKDSVDALIEWLDETDGLAKYRIAMTLGDLTGNYIGDSATDWRNWWKFNRKDFKVKDKPKPTKPKAAKKPKKRGKKKGDDDDDDEKSKDGRAVTGKKKLLGKSRVRFHGIPIVSTRIFFLQDRSGGMKNPVDKSDSDSPRKMDFANKELKRVLKQLDDKVFCNVGFFATEWSFTANKLFPIKKARGKLIEFVGKESAVPSGKAKGRSNLYDTLVAAMVDEDVDTIYFLSEGGPTEGLYIKTRRFMRHLVRLNVYQRVQIHSLQVTTSSFGEKFLKELSAQTSGEFYDFEFLKKASGL